MKLKVGNVYKGSIIEQGIIDMAHWYYWQIIAKIKRDKEVFYVGVKLRIPTSTYPPLLISFNQQGFGAGYPPDICWQLERKTAPTDDMFKIFSYN